MREGKEVEGPSCAKAQLLIRASKNIYDSEVKHCAKSQVS